MGKDTLNRFVIVSPNYNGGDWILKNRESVLTQDYSGEIIQVYVDDNSTDSSQEILRNLESVKNLYCICKANRAGCVHSHLLPFMVWDSHLKENDIIVHLDADDWFADSKVLSRVNEVYNNTDCLLTYGNYRTTDGSPSICRPLEDDNFRDKIINGGWCFSHLRTFRKHLLDSLPWHYLFDYRGNLLTHAADTVLYLPLMEFAGRSKIQFIDEINVIYNRHKGNEDKTRQEFEQQIFCARVCSNKKINYAN